jgi:hypothetical protein
MRPRAHLRQFTIPEGPKVPDVPHPTSGCDRSPDTLDDANHPLETMRRLLAWFELRCPESMKEADQPNQMFHDRVRRQKGVLAVDPFGGRAVAEQSFVVYVAPGDLDAVRRVYRVKAEVYDKFPDARLDVCVEERATS